MILRRINSNRAAFIIGESLGIQLKDFFVKHQKKLILGKHKVQNLPKKFQNSIKILFELNDEEFELFRSWGISVLDRSADNSVKVELAEAIGYFLVGECKLATGVKNKEKDRFYSRVVLLELLKENPDLGLIDFLSSEIPYGSIQEKSPQPPGAAPRDAFNQKVISTILDGTFSENLDELRIESETLSIDFDLLKNKLEKIQQPETTQGQTSPAADQVFDTQHSRSLTSEDKIDLDEVTVYAYVTKVLDSGLRFLTPIAIEIDNQLIHLDKKEAKTIFPNTGDLVWYLRDEKRTLSTNQFGMFSVELSHVAQKSQDATTTYSVKQFISKIDPVIKVDGSINSLIKLGDWLKQNEERLATSESLFLFKNLLIKPHFKNNMHIQFETKMEVIESPKILDIGHKFYVNDFKTSDRYYDFSPIDLIIKKLIKQSNEPPNKLTKAQLNGLIKTLEEFKAEAPLLDPHYYDEAINRISKFISFQSNLESLAEDILGIETVKSRIDDAIAARVKESQAKFEDSKAQLIAELNQVRVQVDEARNNLKREEEKAKKIKSSLASDISEIYSEAVDDGKKILSQSALFEGILNKTNGLSVEPETSFSICDFDGNNLDEDVLYKLVPSDATYKNFINLLESLHELGFSFVLTGVYALFIGKILAFQLNKKQIDVRIVDVYPGASKFPEVIARDSNQTLMLQNFDISPISVYGRKLLEDAYLSLHIKDLTYKKQLILLREDTGLGLEAPKMLDMFAIHIDTDHISEYKESSEMIDFEEFEDMLKKGENFEKFKMIVRAIRNNITRVSFKDDSAQLSSTLFFLARHFS